MEDCGSDSGEDELDKLISLIVAEAEPIRPNTPRHGASTSHSTSSGE